MFTGIITGIGQITSISPKGAGADDGLQLSLQCPEAYLDDVGLGDSIAINGACMTVTSVDAATARFTLDISSESLDKTAGLDQPGPVNLEKALRAHDRLGGHIVSGHVDAVATVLSFDPVGDDWKELCIEVPPDLAGFFAYKGSVAIQGVSLTVNTVTDLPSGCRITVRLIPHTLEHTTLGLLAPGHRVNIEVDTVARYVSRMMQVRSTASAP